MRVFVLVVLLSFSLAIAAARAAKPASGSAPPQQAAKAAAKPAATMGKATGNLAQLMRGVMFPNSNLIFDAQTHDPGEAKAKSDSDSSTAGASAAFSNVYTGWQVVENAAIALAESADLM